MASYIQLLFIVFFDFFLLHPHPPFPFGNEHFPVDLAVLVLSSIESVE